MLLRRALSDSQHDVLKPCFVKMSTNGCYLIDNEMGILDVNISRFNWPKTNNHI